MIKKILDKQASKEDNLLNEVSAINEVKLLLDNNSMEDLHLLQNAFPNSTNSQVINENGVREEVKKLKQIHNGDVYTSEEIKSLCMKYRLRFLSSTLYKGNVPIELIHEMKRKFSDENKMAHFAGGSKLIYQRNLFMLAPASMFRIESYGQMKRRELSEAKRMRRLDPACFVKLDNDKYLFLKEWGNSFSFLRRIYGALTAKYATINMLFFLSWVLFVYVCVSIIIEIGSLVPNKSGVTLWIIPFIFILIASFLLIISWMCSAEEGFFMSYFKDKDRGLFKTDKRLATENNWDRVYGV